MYSPKIKEEYIPVLYQIAKKQNKPMTSIVNELIAEALAEQQDSSDCSQVENNNKEVYHEPVSSQRRKRWKSN